MGAVGFLKRNGGWGVLAAALLAPLALGTAGAAALAPSHATVSAFPLPKEPPTGGDGPLIVPASGEAWFSGTYPEIFEPGEEAHYYPQVMRIDALGRYGTVTKDIRAGGFAQAPDGSVWFARTRSIGRIAPSGEVTEFELPGDSVADSQAAGPIVATADGNLWFSGYRGAPTGDGSDTRLVAAIGRIAPSGEIAQFDQPGQGTFPSRLAVGPDGEVWFTESGDRVGHISPAGQIRLVSLPAESRPYEIVSGSDGNLWVTLAGETSAGALGRITPTGEFREFRLEPGVYASALLAAPDGRLWFSSGPGAIGRLSPAGRLSLVRLPQPTNVLDLAAGPEGSVWYTARPVPPCAPRDAACGAGGNYESGIVGRIEPAPLAIEIGGAKPAAKGRRAKLKIACLDGPAASVCQGMLQLRAAGTPAVRRGFELGNDLTRTFSLRLEPAARARLQRRGHLRITAKATLSNGQATTRTIRLRLRPRHKDKGSVRGKSPK
jgi:streptogramin lyase